MMDCRVKPGNDGQSRVPDAVRHSKAMRSIADHAAPQSRDRTKHK
jgi:hypothetical protein